MVRQPLVQYGILSPYCAAGAIHVNEGFVTLIYDQTSTVLRIIKSYLQKITCWRIPPTHSALSSISSDNIEHYPRVTII